MQSKKHSIFGIVIVLWWIVRSPNATHTMKYQIRACINQYSNSKNKRPPSETSLNYDSAGNCTFARRAIAGRQRAIEFGDVSKKVRKKSRKIFDMKKIRKKSSQKIFRIPMSIGNFPNFRKIILRKSLEQAKDAKTQDYQTMSYFLYLLWGASQLVTWSD